MEAGEPEACDHSQLKPLARPSLLKQQNKQKQNLCPTWRHRPVVPALEVSQEAGMQEASLTRNKSHCALETYAMSDGEARGEDTGIVLFDT